MSIACKISFFNEKTISSPKKILNEFKRVKPKTIKKRLHL